MSTSRIDSQNPAYKPLQQAMYGLERVVKQSKLEPTLIELVKMRASQINGCAFCLDMHSKDARAQGESEQRLYCLPAWRETPFYSERERAALEWTEELTRIAETDVSDALFERVHKQFDDEELATLTTCVSSRLMDGTAWRLRFAPLPDRINPLQSRARTHNALQLENRAF